MTVSAYTLQWPDPIPRWTGERKPGAFKATLQAAMENVSTSLRLFGADSGKPIAGVVYSSNVTLGVDRPRDPGVAVWFTWENVQICIPVDRYSTPEANLQAIHHIPARDGRDDRRRRPDSAGGRGPAAQDERHR